MTDENKNSFTGVNTDTRIFEKFQRAVKLACALTKQQEYKEKGDDSMATQYATFLSEEERIAALEEGEKSGLSLAKEIMKMLKDGVPTPEIAKKCRMTIREVEEFKVAM